MFVVQFFKCSDDNRVVSKNLTAFSNNQYTGIIPKGELNIMKPQLIIKVDSANIGELMGFDDLKVYAFEEYKNMIRHAFEKYMEKDYFPQELSLTRVNLSFLQNHLNRESIVGFFLHQMKYKEAMDMKSYYTFCKKELMMASLIYLLIGGLTDEHH